MLKKTRPDGTLIKKLPAFTLLLPYLLPSRKDATIYYEQEVDVTETLPFIKEFNREFIKERQILTLFDVVICAVVRAIALRPRVNRFISGRRYWQRNEISCNFVAKKELTDDGQEVNVKIAFDPALTLANGARLIKQRIRAATEDSGIENEAVVETLAKLPDFLLRLLIGGMNWLDSKNLMLPSLIESDPMWCSVFLTNVGSFGLDAPYHHLFERGNCPIFLAVGKVRKQAVLQDDGSLTQRKILVLRYSYDERVAEGVYMGRTLDLVRTLIENPAGLVQPPELSAETVAELQLKPLPRI
ncbi:MAG: 2-oxo acid dehydrogenase subunit E2 [Spirochaetes bacterium]|nr:2-oxo acid dehydrogenase subunit E2 [Spirochaetota bacterium]MBU0955180.1 2-oxo acid dehydrogenase subunit E2 [Spirochaetota bacterium]